MNPRLLWLRRLADALQCAEPARETLLAYLDELSSWALTLEQWDELHRRAVLRQRFPRLPMLSDLAVIRDEIVQEDAARAAMKKISSMQKLERCECPRDVAEQLNLLFRR